MWIFARRPVIETTRVGQWLEVLAVPSSMEQLERTVVQLWEARRLAAWGDVPHGRLALLLLDNAAEMSLARTAQVNMSHADMYSGMAFLLRDVGPSDAEGWELEPAIEIETVSKKQKKQVERNFDALVDYVLGTKGFALSADFAECLKILHRYRNAAYHRDTVRADVLGPAVQILFFLCCHLLKNERHLWHELNAAPQGVLEIFDGNPPEAGWPARSFDSASLAVHAADRLLELCELDHQGIAAALSDHLIARLAAFTRDLDEISASIPPGINRWAALQLIQQAPRDPEDFEAVTPPGFWTRSLPVTEQLIDTWIANAQALRHITVAHEALRAFAEIERPLEVIEEPVARFIYDLDRLEQHRIDLARGK